ncbi:MAG: hypothetical protein K2H38_06000 [Muribaculaceae bacterium]|nr:hypothetical protein [Muribaculaceae bacterium]
MEEDKIKDIFSNYDPELTSSLEFMERLERNLDAVELIHRENAAVMKRNRIAVTVAAIAGFLSGILFTLLLPYLMDMIQSLITTLPGMTAQNINPGYAQALSWILIGAASVFIAVNAYDITLALKSSSDARPEG